MKQLTSYENLYCTSTSASSLKPSLVSSNPLSKFLFLFLHTYEVPSWEPPRNPGGTQIDLPCTILKKGNRGISALLFVARLPLSYRDDASSILPLSPHTPSLSFCLYLLRLSLGLHTDARKTSRPPPPQSALSRSTQPTRRSFCMVVKRGYENTMWWPH